MPHGLFLHGCRPAQRSAGQRSAAQRRASAGEGQRSAAAFAFVYVETPFLGFRPFSGFWPKTNMIWSILSFLNEILLFFFFRILENFGLGLRKWVNFRTQLKALRRRRRSAAPSAAQFSWQSLQSGLVWTAGYSCNLPSQPHDSEIFLLGRLFRYLVHVRNTHGGCTLRLRACARS